MLSTCILAALALGQGLTVSPASIAVPGPGASASPTGISVTAPPRPPLSPRPAMPRPALKPSVPQGMERYDGVLTVSHACGDEDKGGAAIVRLEDAKSKPIRLEFSPEMLRSMGSVTRMIGVHVSVTGRMDRDRNMVVESFSPMDQGEIAQPLDVRMGFAKETTGKSKPPSLGNHRYITILVRYADSPGVMPFTNAWLKDLYRSTFPGLNHYFNEGSYGQFNIDNSDVIGWVTLPQAQAAYASSTTGWGVDWDKITADATAAVDSQVDFTKYYGINVIPNVLMGNIGGLGGQRYLTLDGITRLWGLTYDNPQTWNIQDLLAHETGHTLGFPHSSGPYSQTYDSLWDVMSNGYLPNGDPTYGTLGIPTIAYNKMLAGWIPSNRILEALPGTDQTVRFERLSNPASSNGYLTARIYINGSATHYYTLEARRFAASYDLPGGLPAEGMLIHDVDEIRLVTDPFTGQLVQGRNAQVVDADGNGNCNDAGAAWVPGETFTNVSAGITVSVLSSDASGYTVRVQVAAGKPLPFDLTNTNDSGPGSLRNAMYYAQSHPGTTVSFKLPTSDPNFVGGVFRIHALTYLPDISGSDTTIDGTTQTALTGDTNAAGPEVFIDGMGTAYGHNAIWVIASRFKLKGVAIGNFGGGAIVLDGQFGSSDATFTGNYFGVAPNGNIAAPNAFTAIYMFRGFQKVVIGGNTAALRNVISGGTSGGFYAADVGTGDITIKGNYFGVTADGTSRLANGDWNIGVRFGARNVVIGGPGSGEGNVLAGDPYTAIGITEANTGNVTIQGNRIGTNAAGTVAIRNQTGIYIGGGPTNVTIGGSGIAEGNLISGSVFDGITIGATNGVNVYGNRIGTDVTGTFAIPNQGWGVTLIDGSQNCHIGNSGSGQGNLISGNRYVGVGIGNAGANGNFVQGNLIGTNAQGDGPVPQGTGVYIFGGAINNTIGGAGGARNVISGNNDSQINLSDAATANNLVQGNYLGTRPSGNMATATNGWGMYVSAKNTSIVGNVIAGNNIQGIGIGNGATGTVVRGNLIGVGADGLTKIGNGPTGAGITIFGGSSLNTIGGTAIGDGNVISGNAGNGVVVADSGSIGNAIRLNSISGNGGLGINLAASDGSFGVTANDAGDADTGPNNLQNFPVLTSATSVSGTTTVQGTLNSRPNQTYTIDLYASSTADASGYGEGETFLGSKSVTTDASGNATFTLAAPHTSGTFLAATATSSTGDTSEFSLALNVTINLPPPVSGTLTLQDFAGDLTKVPVTVEIRQAGSSTIVETRTVTLDAAGRFSFPTTAAPGTYDLSFKASHWLRRKVATITISASGVSNLAASLVNGDVNGDNVVNSIDQTALTAAFRALIGSGNWNVNADLNGDGQVSGSDQAILGKNFGRSGD